MDTLGGCFSVMAFYDLSLHNCCHSEAGRTDHSGIEKLLLSSVPSRSLPLVTLKNRSCAKSSALKCSGQFSRVVRKRLVMLGVWIFVLCGRLGGSHVIL